MLRFNVLTIFPGLFTDFTATSLLGRAKERGLLSFNVVDIRLFASGRHRQVDDRPYGGSFGMVMKPEPLLGALDSLETGKSRRKRTILFSAAGKPLSQSDLARYSRLEELTLICGRYEGIDERVSARVDEQVSLGDYVLMGGEVPAMAVIEGAARLVDGVMKERGSYIADSFFDGMLDYPVYTRPEKMKFGDVPRVLLSGDHKAIERWQKTAAISRTWAVRPDLILKKELTAVEEEILSGLLAGEKKPKKKRGRKNG